MTTPILTRTIMCPKCLTKTMRKSIPEKWGREWFDDRCRNYFGTDELVFHWGYDAGDFLQSQHLDIMSQEFIDFWGLEDFSVSDEPEWEDLEQRLRDYEIVERMFLGIPEWSMDDYSVDTGATHV